MFGVLAVYQAMLPLLRKSSDARIVHVSSAVGSLTANADPAYPYHSMFGPVYPASKPALNAITLAIMVELESSGIKVNLVSPGFTKTNLNGYEGDPVSGRGVPRSGARCTAWSGRSDGYVHTLGEFEHSVVTPCGIGESPLQRPAASTFGDVNRQKNKLEPITLGVWVRIFGQKLHPASTWNQLLTIRIGSYCEIARRSRMSI